jgi:hypothetical protein
MSGASTLGSGGSASTASPTGFSRFPFSFQFFTRLAAVFAEEFGSFGSFESDRKI